MVPDIRLSAVQSPHHDSRFRCPQATVRENFVSESGGLAS